MNIYKFDELGIRRDELLAGIGEEAMSRLKTSIARGEKVAAREVERIGLAAAARA